MIKISVSGLLFLVLLSGCENNGLKDESDNFGYIKYGTSFGECLGYCVKQIRISDSQIIFTKNGWDLEGKLPQIQRTETINGDYWVHLDQKIEINDFLQLDSIIGCPDCADGGAEWIEINTGDTTHKVVFEYWNEPEAVKGYIDYLRTFMYAFEIEPDQEVNFDDRTYLERKGKIKNFVCSRGCFQYLIEMISNDDTTYYYDKFMSKEYQKDNLEIRFNGILQYDSTTINKPAPNDIPVFDFKARNIMTFGIRMISE